MPPRVSRDFELLRRDGRAARSGFWSTPRSSSRSAEI
jgi:hypothetical protein